MTASRVKLDEPITNPKGVSVPVLTALVIGSMIGGGIFGMPSQMARAAALGPMIIGWIIAGVGMLFLALVFQSLAVRFPKVDGGVYGYAREGFGNFIGYCSAIGYWFGAWVGNVAFLVLMGSAVGTFFPSFAGGNTVPAIILGSVVLWVVHFLVLRGVHEAAFVNVIVTIAKVVPLVTFIAVVVFAFKANVLTADVWGKTTQVATTEGAMQALGSPISQIVAMMLIAVWVFSGVEGASIFSERARRRSDVGKATVVGFIFVLALYVLINVIAYAAMSQTDVSQLSDPSLAGLFASVVGPWGAKFVAVGLIISLLGVLLSWVLLCTEILRIPAQEGVLPKSIGRLNEHKTPSVALWMSTFCAQGTLLVTLFSEKTYEWLIFLAAGVLLFPYLGAALFQVKTALSKVNMTSGRSVAYERTIGIIAVIYTLWLIYAGRDYILPSALIYIVFIPLYIMGRKETGDKHIFKRYEYVIVAVLAVMSVAFLILAFMGKLGAMA